jgi:hypothetical protein
MRVFCMSLVSRPFGGPIMTTAIEDLFQLFPAVARYLVVRGNRFGKSRTHLLGVLEYLFDEALHEVDLLAIDPRGRRLSLSLEKAAQGGMLVEIQMDVGESDEAVVPVDGSRQKRPEGLAGSSFSETPGACEAPPARLQELAHASFYRRYLRQERLVVIGATNMTRTCEGGLICDRCHHQNHEFVEISETGDESGSVKGSEVVEQEKKGGVDAVLSVDLTRRSC